MKIFFPIFAVVLTLIAFYSYKRFLVKNLSKIISIFIITMLLIFSYSYIFLRYFSFRNDDLKMISSYSIGFLFMLFVISLLYDLYFYLLNFFKFDLKKRDGFKRFSNYSFYVATLGYGGAGISGGLEKPTIKTIEFEIKKLKNKLNIVQLSDTHFGGEIGVEFANLLKNEVEKLNPDILVITGDLVDSHIDFIQEEIKIISSIKTKYGIFFVAGNHDYFYDIDALFSYLKKLNITILDNRSVKIKHFEDEIYLVGLNDLFGNRVEFYKPDPQKAFKNIYLDQVVVLLAHQPKIIDHLDDFQFDLMLSGHTHGGQIYPFNYIVSLAQPYIKGLNHHKNRKWIYVNEGTGYWGPRLRVNAPSEITNIFIS